MDGYALYIDYEYCSGCKSCELACRNEHDYSRGEWGIKVYEEKPWQAEDGSWNWDYIPVPTNLCDLCKDRVEKGLQPSCVQHCQAKVIEYGTYAELMDKMANKHKSAIFRP